MRRVNRRKCFGKRIVGKIIGEEIQNRKDTNHISHIVVCDKGQHQGNAVKPGPAFFYDFFNSQNDKREQIHCVHPHDVPIIRHEIAAKRVKHTERRGSRIVFPDGAFQVIGK